jgi:hypothetical protein
MNTDLIINLDSVVESIVNEIKKNKCRIAKLEAQVTELSVEPVPPDDVLSPFLLMGA